MEKKAQDTGGSVSNPESTDEALLSSKEVARLSPSASSFKAYAQALASAKKYRAAIEAARTGLQYLVGNGNETEKSELLLLMGKLEIFEGCYESAIGHLRYAKESGLYVLPRATILEIDSEIATAERAQAGLANPNRWQVFYQQGKLLEDKTVYQEAI